MFKGSGNITFIELVRDTIETFGISWAVKFYAKKLSRNELRHFMKVAYCD